MRQTLFCLAVFLGTACVAKAEQTYSCVFDMTDVPEPASFALLFAGAVGLLFACRRKLKLFAFVASLQRRSYQFLLFVFLAVVSVGNANGQVQYTVTGLLPAETNGQAYGINDSGDVVGYAQASDCISYAFLYSGGSLQNLGTLPGGLNSAAYGINNLGQIVGYANISNVGGNAFLYNGSGPMQILVTPAGTESIARGINNLGQIVGDGATSSGQGGAFLWSGSSRQFIGGSTSACGINDSAQVVGHIQTSSNALHAFLWSSGSGMQDLGTLGGVYSFARGINNLGQVVGYSLNSSNVYRGFLWSSGSGMQDLGTLSDATEIEANCINNLGQIVGEAYITGDGFNAFVYSNGSIRNLNNLIAPDSGWTLTRAYGINDNGQICGYGSYDGRQNAFLLTPIPEPSTVAVLFAGAVGLLFGVPRKVVRVRGACQTSSIDLRRCANIGPGLQ